MWVGSSYKNSQCYVPTQITLIVSRSFTPIPLLEDPVVVEIAKRHSKGPAHVLMKYWIQQNIAVIPKSVNPERVRSNFDVSVATFYIRIDMTILSCILVLTAIWFRTLCWRYPKTKGIRPGRICTNFFNVHNRVCYCKWSLLQMPLWRFFFPF